MSPERLHRSMNTLAVTIVLCVAIVAATMVATVLYVKHANAVRHDQAVATCERGNQIRANLNAINVYLDLHLPVLPIIDCPATVH